MSALLAGLSFPVLVVLTCMWDRLEREDVTPREQWRQGWMR